MLQNYHNIYSYFISFLKILFKSVFFLRLLLKKIGLIFYQTFQRFWAILFFNLIKNCLKNKPIFSHLVFR